MSRHRIALLGGVLGLAFGLASGAAASTRGHAKTPTGKPIIIGAAIARSGFVNFFDGPVAAGAEVAVADINAKGGLLGRPVKIIYSDTKSDIAQATNAALEVISKGATVVLTTCDYDFGGPAARAANQKGLIAFSCAGDHRYGVAGIGPLTYNTFQGVNTEAASMAEWSYSKGWRHPFLVTDSSISYTKEECKFFKQRWSELAGAKSIVGEDTMVNTDSSFAAQVTRLRGLSTKPDLLVICSYPPGGATFVRQLRAAGFKQPIMASTAYDGNYWLKAVPGLKDFYFAGLASIFGDDPDPQYNVFLKKYKALTHADPPSSLYPISGYTGVQMWALAVQRAGTTDAKAVQRELDKFRNEPLLAGPSTYTPTCHIPIGRRMTIIEVRGGRDHFVQRFQPKKPPKAAC